MQTMDLEIYKRVRSGQMTSKQAAEHLETAETVNVIPPKPRWMPRALYFGLVVVIAAVLSPIIAPRANPGA